MGGGGGFAGKSRYATPPTALRLRAPPSYGAEGGTFFRRIPLRRQPFQTIRIPPFILSEGHFQGQTIRKPLFVLAEGYFQGQTIREPPFVLAEGYFRGQTIGKPPFILAEGEL